MKIAVIFYSLNGNTEVVATEVAKILSADAFRIETVESGFFSVVKQLLLKNFLKLRI